MNKELFEQYMYHYMDHPDDAKKSEEKINVLLNWRKQDALTVAIEEMSELSKELSKISRGNGSRISLLEEMGDVMVCLKKIVHMYNITHKELQASYDAKVNYNLDRYMTELRDGMYSPRSDTETVAKADTKVDIKMKKEQNDAKIDEK